MEKEIREFLGDVREFCAALQEYFALKNKTLYSGDWTSGSITITEIGKYHAVDVYCWKGVSPVRCYKFDGCFLGGGITSPVSSNGIHTDLQIRFGVTKTKLTWDYVRLLHHNNASSHGTQYTDLPIVKIVGVEPIIPTSLQKYLGGGG